MIGSLLIPEWDFGSMNNFYLGFLHLKRQLAKFTMLPGRPDFF